MSHAELLGPEDHHLVVSDWSILKKGDRVRWYSRGKLIGTVRVIMRVSEDDAILGDPDDVGQGGYRGQEVYKGHGDLTSGDQLSFE